MESLTIGTISFPESFKEVLREAFASLKQKLQTQAPELAKEWEAWTIQLAGGTDPVEYFLHPYAFPTLLLPWWLDQSLAKTANLSLQSDLLRSSLAGYYVIRFIDDLVDGDSPELTQLLPLVPVLQAEFHDAYQAYTNRNSSLQNAIHVAWTQCHEASWKDSKLQTIDEHLFKTISARKVGAVKAPLLAVACHHGLNELPSEWISCIDQLGAWHQFHNDLFDWQRDLQAQRTTWFTSEIERRRGNSSGLLWVATEGFAWGVSQLQEWGQQLINQSNNLGCDGLTLWMQERTDILQRVSKDVIAGFQQFAPLMHFTGSARSLGTSANPFTKLFESGYAMFQRFCDELQRHGLDVSPSLQFEKGNGLLVAYDLEQTKISVSLPNPEDPIGRLQMAIFKPMLGCATDAEMARFIELLLPRLIGHELGHHLRHHYGCFGKDLWHEEQVANILASALTRTVYDPTSRKELILGIKRAMAALSKTLDAQSLAVVSHHSPVSAWLVDGHLNPHLARTAGLLADLLHTTPEQLLAAAGRLPPEAVAGLDHRGVFVDHFNETYTRSLQLYTYLQLSWLLVDLECGTDHYIGELGEELLGIRTSIPPVPGISSATAKFASDALAAHLHLKLSHPAVSRYFFKRYRQAVLLSLNIDSVSLLEVLDEEQDGTLDLVGSIISSRQRAAGANLEPLFQVDASNVEDINFEEPADARLWQWAAHQVKDHGAAILAERLQWLDNSELFRAIPADALVRLAKDLHPVQLNAGDVLLWQDSRSEDLFILNTGTLMVEREAGQKNQTLAKLDSGSVVGDLAFLTGAPRTATVKALTSCQGAVIRARTVRLLSAEHPVIMMHLARILATRLSNQQMTY